MKLVAFVADGITQAGILPEKGILPLAALGYFGAIASISHGQAFRRLVAEAGACRRMSLQYGF